MVSLLVRLLYCCLGLYSRVLMGVPEENTTCGVVLCSMLNTYASLETQDRGARGEHNLWGRVTLHVEHIRLPRNTR